jgi:hypothetical protein
MVTMMVLVKDGNSLKAVLMDSDEIGKDDEEN